MLPHTRPRLRKMQVPGSQKHLLAILDPTPTATRPHNLFRSAVGGARRRASDLRTCTCGSHGIHHDSGLQGRQVRPDGARQQEEGGAGR